ncbi:MAG: hypothetical protein ACRCXC_05615 [Legionella sp.]
MWTGPGAFFTAVTGASGASLGVVAAAGCSGGWAGILTGWGLFKHSDELRAAKQFVHECNDIIEPTFQLVH